MKTLEEKKPNETRDTNRMARRKFLGGLAAASATIVILNTSAYQLWTMGMDVWENSLAKFAVPTSNGYVIFDPALCTGCQSCEAACTTFNRGVSNPSLARIQVIRDPFRPDYYSFTPTPCLQCETPRCLPVCPVAALKIDMSSGTNSRVIDETECIGCGKCIEACGATHGVSRIRFDEARNTSLKCNLCSGEPRCAKYCPNGALKYVGELPNGKAGEGESSLATFADERAEDIPWRPL
jgi:Fe-S-cluster-containing hydrogenase component 2